MRIIGLQKRLALVVLVLLVSGCTTAHIPVYVQKKQPYAKRFYAYYDDMLAATTTALSEMGWEIETMLPPSVYEKATENDLDEHEQLIITAVRQTKMFIGTRYARMNVYVRSKKNISELEVRYVTVTSLPLKVFVSYRNESAVDRFFDLIAKILREEDS